MSDPAAHAAMLREKALEYQAAGVEGIARMALESDAALADMIANLADLVIALTSAKAERPPVPVIHPLTVGREYDLVLRVRARIVEASDGPGQCYEIKLDQRDFYEGRTVSVDASEIERASPRQS